MSAWSTGRGVFSAYDRLRRRRNELDYPIGPEDFADTKEAETAIAAATTIVEDAQKILDQGVLTQY